MASEPAQPDDGPHRASELRAAIGRAAPLAGALAAAVGLVTLTGSLLGVGRLMAVVPGWPAQTPNAALLCLLGGGALILDARTSRAARLAGAVCAAVIALLAGLTSLEYLAHAELGIDRLLPQARPAAGAFPARPSPQTAIAFLITSVALLALGRTRGRAAGAVWIPALLSGSLAAVGLLGYAFGAPALYRVAAARSDVGMSIQTALALVVLNGGILLARPDVGPLAIVTSPYAGGVAARRFLGGLLAFVPIALLVALGKRFGWYGEPVAAALLAFLGLIVGATIILGAAVRLDRDDVGRREAEARAHERDQHFRELFEQADEGIIIAAIDGCYIDVNPAACQLLGYSRDELVGRRTADFLSPEDVERLVRVREELLGGRPQLAEWRMRHRDGSFIPVEVSTKFPAGGRWHAFIRDISDRKQRETELARAQEAERGIRREIEEVTQAALSVAETAAAMPEPDLPAVLQAFALQAQLLTGARWVAIGLGTEPDRPFDEWITVGEDAAAAAIESPPRPSGVVGVFDVPIRYRGRRLGRVYLAKAGTEAIADRDQRLVEMLAARAAVAIEMVRLSSGAAAKRAWLLSIIDQMPEGVIVLNQRGGVEAMNRALLRLSNSDGGAVDAQGNPATFEVHEMDGTPVPFTDFLVVRALIRGEVAIDHELVVRVRDGRMVPVLVNAAPVRDEAGQINGAVAVIRDISAIRELERLREEWASVIAHDLRQPVGAISMTVESVLRAKPGTSPERQRRSLERIRSASSRLNRMIDDLLDASRIEAKRLTVEPRLTDLGAIIEAAVEGHREATAGSPVEVVLPQGPGGRIACLDPDRVHQILGNLLSNAVKYGEHGTEIRIECREAGDELEVSVTNRGRGIPADELPRLFSRFGRARGARDDRIPGLGLGLYIARGLVEAQGGRMWAESVPGRSASFHFTLPRSPRPQATQAEPTLPT